MTLDGESLTALVRSTGRPARMSYGGASGSMAALLREHGIRCGVWTPIFVAAPSSPHFAPVSSPLATAARLAGTRGEISGVGDPAGVGKVARGARRCRVGSGGRCSTICESCPEASIQRPVFAFASETIVSGYPERGSGLVGLRDRVEALGRCMTLVSPLGEGTSVLVDLPVSSGQTNL
jgi:hypothetical protein